MPRSRRKQILWGTIAVIAIVVVVVFLVNPPERISTWASRKIQLGMTRSQVESFLGGPASDGRTPLDDIEHKKMFPGDRWHGKRMSLIISFDSNDRVESVSRYYPGPLKSSWYRNLQGWLPLPD